MKLKEYLASLPKIEPCADHNAWPNLAVVGVSVHSKPSEVWSASLAVNRDTFRQPRVHTIPAEIRKFLDLRWWNPNAKYANQATFKGVYFGWEPPSGQVEFGTPNVLAIFPPARNWNPNDSFDSECVVVATLGCRHDFEQTHRSRSGSYRESTCKICGYRVGVDTS